MFRKKLVIGWLLVSFWLLGPAAGAVEVVKSPNDDRQYQYLELPNRMKVLLVSDPKADKAAAALTVGVGSTANPPGREGLAHFLEHMLFMGTKKYPEVDEYSAFIKKNGGMDNAFTGGNQTTYYFDIKPEALEPGLDIKVGEVSRRTRKGQHTTTVVQLFPLSFGGFVIDTPGIRELGFWDIFKRDLHKYFREFRQYESDCQFADCLHIHEPGCAVKAAVERGEILEERYHNYLAIYASLRNAPYEVR